MSWWRSRQALFSEAWKPDRLEQPSVQWAFRVLTYVHVLRLAFASLRRLEGDL